MPVAAVPVAPPEAVGAVGGALTTLPWLFVMTGGLGLGLMEMPLEKVAGLPLPATTLTVGDTSMNTGETCAARTRAQCCTLGGVSFGGGWLGWG